MAFRMSEIKWEKQDIRYYNKKKTGFEVQRKYWEMLTPANHRRIINVYTKNVSAFSGNIS